MQPGLSAGWIPLPDSERRTPPGAKWLGPVNPNESIEFVIHARSRMNDEALEAGYIDRGDDADQGLELALGDAGEADPVDLDKIQEFVRQTGFTIVDVSLAGRSVVVSGTAADISSIFRVELAYYRYGGEVRRGQIGPIYLPRTIAHAVEAISGLDDDLPVRTGLSSLGAWRVAAQPFVVPALALVAGSALGVFLFKGAGTEHTTPVPSARISVSQQVGAAPPLASGGALQKLELAGWKAFAAGRLREAQDDFLNVLSLDPNRPNVMRGLVAVRRRLGRDDPRVIRQQMAVYQEAISNGSGTGEYYTPSALSVLVAASLSAAKELEAQNGQTAVAPPATTHASVPSPPAARSAPPKAPSKPADHQPAPPAAHPQKPPDAAAAHPPARPATPAPPVASNQSTPVSPAHTAPPVVPAQKPSVTSTPPVPPAQSTPVSSSQTPPAAAVSPPAPVPQVPPVPDRLFRVQIGPVADRARASAIATQLSLRGFAQPQVVTHTGYRVVSEPLPRKEADSLAAALAGKGIRSYAEPLTGETVQLLFGAFTTQKDAEAMASRIAAAGYDAWLRETTVYTLHLGPYPTASVNTITDIVKTGAPEAAVTAEPAP